MRFGDGEAGAFDVVETAVHRIDADAVFSAAAADEATGVNRADDAVRELEVDGGSVFRVIVFNVGDDAATAESGDFDDFAEEVAAHIERMDGLFDGLTAGRVTTTPPPHARHSANPVGVEETDLRIGNPVLHERDEIDVAILETSGVAFPWLYYQIPS